MIISLEVTCHDHSIIACSCHIYISVVLRVYPVHGESHTQCNANGEVETSFPHFYNEPHWSHNLFVKSPPGTMFTSWSQHHFVAIGNPERQVHKASHWGSKKLIEIMHRNHSTHMLVIMFNRSHACIIRDYMPWSLYYCLFMRHIHECWSWHTTRSWWITHSMPTERLQQYLCYILFKDWQNDLLFLLHTFFREIF